MRFVEAVLLEPEKDVVALADAYFFPPFQPSLLPRAKGSAVVVPSRLPPRRARLVVYNKKSNETSIWIVELSEEHAAARGGHDRGKVVSSRVVPDVQPAMVYFIRSTQNIVWHINICVFVPNEIIPLSTFIRHSRTLYGLPNNTLTIHFSYVITLMTINL